jgi:hypothetical protein
MFDRMHREDTRHGCHTQGSVPGTDLGRAPYAHDSFLVAEESRRLQLGQQVAGDTLRLELRCASCGYGVVVRVAPDRCPMCRLSVWEFPDSPSGPGPR